MKSKVYIGMKILYFYTNINLRPRKRIKDYMQITCLPEEIVIFQAVQSFAFLNVAHAVRH